MSIAWPETTPDGVARSAATSAFDVNDDFLFRTVDYSSSGGALVVGSAQRIESMLSARAKDSASSALRFTALVTDGERPALADDIDVYQAEVKSITGHLGAWSVQVERDAREFDLGELVHGDKEPYFDLLFDLQQPVAIDAQVAPLGYFAPSDTHAESAALEAAAELVGEFQKPRFFSYNPDICAHGRAGITGCTRCIDACPTDAIISVGEEIEVNPYLCQGGGVCASTCPSGAMTYAYPPAADTLTALRAGIKAYLEAGGTDACLLIHDEESGALAVAQSASALPENCIAFPVEEAATLGLDAWLAMLAWGAGSVRIVTTDATGPSVIKALQEQIDVAAAMATFVGLSEDSVAMVPGNRLASMELPRRGPSAVPAGFAPPGDKRSLVRLAFDHLRTAGDRGSDNSAVVALPSVAPFGQVTVDSDKCTLCMSCASVCPSAAITAGGDAPALRFTEWNCVQCGTCETACPESAITLEARFLTDNDQRMSTRTLNEEAPFECVKCGKPFATASVMRRMQEKLSDHWMFQNPEQMARLKMCEDCRVMDLYAAEGGLTISAPPNRKS